MIVNKTSQPLRNSDGITITQLKNWIKDLPEVDQNGDDYEVWVATDISSSTPATLVSKLNDGDILIESYRLP